MVHSVLASLVHSLCTSAADALSDLEKVRRAATGECNVVVCCLTCVCGAVWVYGCGACTPVTRWSRHTHTIATSTPSTRGIPHYPLTNCPPSCPCPRPQQQPGSPLQSVPTSPTACSSACAPSSSLSR